MEKKIVEKEIKNDKKNSNSKIKKIFKNIKDFVIKHDTIFIIILVVVSILVLFMVPNQITKKKKEEHDSNYYSVKKNTTNSKEKDKCRSISINIDKSYVFSPNENPIFGYTRSLAENEEIDVSMKLYKFNSKEEYTKFLNDEQEKIDDLKLLNEYNTKMKQGIENQRVAYFELPTKLEKGYYLLVYSDKYCKDGKQPFIVSNMSAYVANTERDTLVWVYDNDNKEPLENIDIILKNKKYKTNKDGLIILENDKNHDDNYSQFLTIKNDSDEIVVAIENFNIDNYYTGFIYTDKPIYKQTDIMNIWGYVPVDLFIDDIDYDNFKVKIGGEEIKVKPNKNGIFKTQYKLNNSTEKSVFVSLLYNDKKISENPYIEIYNYDKTNVEYTIVTDRTNYMYNDQINVEISAKNLIGESVPNKKVQLDIPSLNKKLDCTLNENGICTMSFQLSDDDSSRYYHGIEDVYLNLYDSDNKQLTSKKIIMSSNEYDLEIKEIVKGDNIFNYGVTLNKVSVVNDSFVFTPTSGTIDFKTTEIKCKRSLLEPGIYEGGCDLGEEKKDINKKYYVQNGYLEITDINLIASVLMFKEYALETNYNYFYFEIVDKYNMEISKSISVPIKNANNNYIIRDVSSTSLFKMSLLDLVPKYHYPISIYSNVKTKYDSNNKKMKYHINENIDLTVNKNPMTELKKENNLTFFYKEKVIDTFIDKQNVEFKDKYFPGVNVGGAYYNKEDSKMYLVKTDYLDFDETDRQVEISMSLDKDVYKPNDTVTLNINVKDKNGNPVKTDMLISVVDNAIFVSKEDRNDRIVSIYNDKTLPFYQYATYQPLPFIPGGAGAAGGIPGDIKIGDTIYFENIKTDDNGNAKVTFKTNDLETTFRITAISANNDLYYGTNILKFISKQ